MVQPRFAGFGSGQGTDGGFSPAQGGTAAAWDPSQLTGLVDEWDADAAYCVTDAACDFDAASDQRLTVSIDSKIGGNATSFWRAMWVKHDATVSGAQRYMTAVSGTTGYSIYQANGTVTARSYKDDTSEDVVNNAAGLTTSTWYFIYMEYTGTRMRVSVNNGAFSQSSADYTYAPSTSGTAYVGGLTATTQDFDGQAQSLCGGDGNLSSGQITALYNSGAGGLYESTTLTTELEFWWNLTEASGSRVDSHASYDLTAVNTPGVAAGVAEGTVQDRSPVKTYTGKTNSETFDQSTVANQPRWIEDGDGSGNPALDFDGTNYTSTLTASLTQGFTLAALVRFDAAGDYLFGGDVSGEFAGRGATNWEAAFGSTISGGTPDDSWHRMIVVANGANSAIYIDGSSVATGDIGAGGVAQVILGAKGDGSAPLDGRVRAVVIADSAADSGDVASLDDYLAAL